MTIVSDYTGIMTTSSWAGYDTAARPTFVTYSFETAVPSTYVVDSFFTSGFLSSFQAFSEAEKAIARDALNQWSASSGLVFIEVPAGQGDMRFASYDFSQMTDPGYMNAAGFAYYPGVSLVGDSPLDPGMNYSYSSDVGGDVFINTNVTNNILLLLHEIGHALGFKHTFDGDPVMDAAHDSRTYTVMSYTGSTPVLGPFDIEAAQAKYGTVDGSNLVSYSWVEATLTLFQVDGDDSDSIVGTSVKDDVFANGGDDLIAGFNGDDTLNGGAGSDIVFGGAGNDTMFGGSGDDIIFGGMDWYDSTSGSATTSTDTVSYADTTLGVLVTLISQYNYETGRWYNAIGSESGTDWMLGIDDVIGGTGGDTFTGDGGDNRLFGGAGQDSLTGGDGNDTLVGNDDPFAQEVDWLNGGNGNDTLIGESIDIVSGGGGTDALYAANSYDWNIDLGTTSVEWFGGAFGNDTINAATQAVGVTVWAGGGNDNVTGSGQGDFLWGEAGDDTMSGGGGSDVIVGAAGIDSLSGGEGDDSVYTDGTDSLLDGGAGTDALYITGSGFFYDLNLAGNHFEWVADFANGANLIDGSGLTVTVVVYAGGQSDIVTGGSEADFLWGEAGDDFLNGRDGADTLVGGVGADTLNGGAGNDTLFGNGGAGGDGAADVIYYNATGWGTDFIYDFEHGIDTIAMAGTGATAGTISIANVGGHAHVQFGADTMVVVGQGATLSSSDFTF